MSGTLELMGVWNPMGTLWVSGTSGTLSRELMELMGVDGCLELLYGCLEPWVSGTLQ